MKIQNNLNLQTYRTNGGNNNSSRPAFGINLICTDEFLQKVGESSIKKVKQAIKEYSHIPDTIIATSKNYINKTKGIKSSFDINKVIDPFKHLTDIVLNKEVIYSDLAEKEIKTSLSKYTEDIDGLHSILYRLVGIGKPVRVEAFPNGMSKNKIVRIFERPKLRITVDGTNIDYHISKNANLGPDTIRGVEGHVKQIKAESELGINNN